MANKIVLISDDSDFFDYIRSKLELRKSDELFMFDFDAVPEKVHLLSTSVIIVNSENAREKTLDLLNIFKGTPIIVSAFNDDDAFRRKCYRAGMLDFMTLLTPDAEFRARMLPALSIAGLLQKNKQYRELLVRNKVITEDNDVFLDYNYILDKELEEVHENKKKAVFAAISPNEKTKFLLKASMIEDVILNNIRRNDILMNYAANKYFLIMFDTDVASAQKMWQKVASNLPEKLYAGFCNISNQSRQHLINEALNKLHEAISFDKGAQGSSAPVVNTLDSFSSAFQVGSSNYERSYTPNFKMFRQEFGKKVEQVITPVFYQIQQKYSGKFSGVMLEHGSGEGYGTFYIKGKHSIGCFRITSPGFSKINIDITYQKDTDNIDAKRITLEPEELEQGLLEDLLEQFISEYKRGCENDI